MQQRILFVDDEPMVLASLRRTMSRLAGDWLVDAAGSVAEALSAVEAASYDIIVTDMKMEDGNGLDLLTSVQKTSPSTVRIVLSGQARSGENIARGGTIHQYLSKPWEPRRLVDVIERAVRVRSLVTDDRFRRSAGELEALPSVPQVLADLSALLDSESATAGQVAEVVERDAAIAAKVLQLVNSGFFGFSRTIANVREGVVYLGANTLRNLLYSVAIFEAFKPAPSMRNFDIERLQAVATSGAALAKKIMSGSENADLAFTAGLLRGVGRLILVSRMPEAYKEVLDMQRSSDMPLHKLEYEHLGVTHADLGAYLLGIWGLPTEVVEAVAAQYTKRAGADREFDALDAVYVAAALVDEHAVGQQALLDPEWSDVLGVSSALPGWRETAQELCKTISGAG